jgi:hypothetical protein
MQGLKETQDEEMMPREKKRRLERMPREKRRLEASTRGHGNQRSMIERQKNSIDVDRLLGRVSFLF